MDYSKKQNELDLQKWYDSESKSYDTCGEYCYCVHCNKEGNTPCANAYNKYYGEYKTVTPKTTKKTCKTTAAKKTTTKKTTCKSTTAKKTTAKKTTTKKTVKA